MMMNRIPAASPTRRAPRVPSGARSPALALLGLALVGLIQAGCRSDGCSTCGFGSKLTNGVRALGASFTKHFDGCKGGDSCGCEGEGTIVDSGMPMISGGLAVPAPGTILPPPSIESAPSQLEVYPNSSMGGANSPSGRNAPNGANKSAYTTMSPKVGPAQARSSDVTRALLSTSDRPVDPQSSSDLFDNIPPVDLPTDVTRKAVAAAAGPSPAPIPISVPAPAPTTATPPVPPGPPASAPVAPTPAEKVSAAEGGAISLPSINAVAPQAPGIRRFASVAPSVGGGSAPSIEGLDWLKEKGYRTFIDLRRSAEVAPDFAEAVNDRNMVYISLPVVANRLDASRLSRFDDMIEQSGNRPLYFCDGDGTRAGLVWFIHLRVVAQEARASAAGKAEEIGLTEAEVKLGEAYILAHKSRAKAAVSKVALMTRSDHLGPMPSAAEESITVPASPPPALPTSPAGSSNPASPPDRGVEPSPSMLPGEDRPQAANPPAPRERDPSSWRPVAGLVLTGIGVPLAFWGRTAFSESRSVRRRASLPGSAPRSPVALSGSDA